MAEPACPEIHWCETSASGADRPHELVEMGARPAGRLGEAESGGGCIGEGDGAHLRSDPFAKTVAEDNGEAESDAVDDLVRVSVRALGQESGSA